MAAPSMTQNKRLSFLAGLIVTIALNTAAFGQSADALVDKLVQKGILSVKEANDLKEEADKNFTTSYQIKSGMPDWVTALRFNGDLRLRYDGIYGPNSELIDRNRMRYRFRFGATAVLRDDFEVGFRLSSGEAARGGSGIDPISGNASFEDNGSRKLIGIDLVYAKWTPIQTPDITLNLAGGKMENPFVVSDIMFDSDYNPEGLAAQLSYTINDKHIARFNAGGFVLDELSASSGDPYLLGAQARLDSTWNLQWQSSFGIGAMAISGRDGLNTGNVPDQNRGNTRDGGGNLVNDYNPLLADASVTYNVESFPTYVGTFPIRLGGEFLHNPGADSDNNAFAAGVAFGKASKRGTWELIYRYKYLEADSWYEEFVDSDTGAFYEAAPVGGRSGYGAGTNLRGHWIRAAWAPYDSFVFSATCYLFELINEVPPGSESETMRLQVDAMWKF
jgi:hypothetical protein